MLKFRAQGWLSLGGLRLPIGTVLGTRAFWGFIGFRVQGLGLFGFHRV